MTGKPRDPMQIFKELDEDGGGSVDRGEFSRGLEACGLDLEPADLDREYLYAHVLASSVAVPVLHIFASIDFQGQKAQMEGNRTPLCIPRSLDDRE